MITLREIGKMEGVILYLMDEGSDENFEKTGSLIRDYIRKWLPTDFATKDLAPIYPFVFSSSDDPLGDPREIGQDATHRQAFKFTWGCCILNAEERIELKFARDDAAALAAAGMRNIGPPVSSLGKSLKSRKLGPYPTYNNTSKEESYKFIHGVEPELTGPLVEVEEGRQLLSSLMAEKGRSFTTSHGFLNATTARGLLGALLLEVECVDNESQLRTRIFCSDRHPDDSLMEFMDRVSNRHQLFLAAFPSSDPDQEGLLNRVIQCLLPTEWSIQVMMRSVTTLAGAREQIRTLNVPGVNTKPSKGRGLGVYLTDTGAPPAGESVEAKEKAPTDALTAQIGALVQAMAAQAASLEKMGERRNSGKCFECQSEEHQIRNCPTRIAKTKARAASAKLTSAEGGGQEDF